LLKKFQSLDGIDNRTNVASVEGSSNTINNALKVGPNNQKPAIQVNVSQPTSHPSPRATHRSLSKPASKADRGMGSPSISDAKSKDSGGRVRNFSNSNKHHGASPAARGKHYSLGLNQQMGMSM